MLRTLVLLLTFTAPAGELRIGEGQVEGELPPPMLSVEPAPPAGCAVESGWQTPEARAAARAHAEAEERSTCLARGLPAEAAPRERRQWMRECGLEGHGTEWQAEVERARGLASPERDHAAQALSEALSAEPGPAAQLLRARLLDEATTARWAREQAAWLAEEDQGDPWLERRPYRDREAEAAALRLALPDAPVACRAEVHARLGWALGDPLAREVDPEGARGHLVAAAEADPDGAWGAWATLALGRHLAHHRSWGAAHRALAQAAIHPGHTLESALVARWWLAAAHAEAGRVEQALREFSALCAWPATHDVRDDVGRTACAWAARCAWRYTQREPRAGEPGWVLDLELSRAGVSEEGQRLAHERLKADLQALGPQP